MDEEKITKLFDELLKELGKHNYEEGRDIYVADLRDDLIILSGLWAKFRGIAVEDD